jgi:hypothetical protein
VKRVSRTTYLVFAIITLVTGAVFITFWSLMLLIQISLTEQFGGASLSPEGYFYFYFFLSMSIVLIAVSILLFVLRAKRAN